MGFGFLSMTARAGVALDPPVDVFVHQVRAILVTLPQERDVGARVRGWADGLGCRIEGRSRALIVRPVFAVSPQSESLLTGREWGKS